METNDLDFHWAICRGPYVDLAWPVVSSFIQAALDKSHGDLSMEDVYKAVKEDRMALWTLAEENEAIGCLVTEIREYPSKRVLYIILASFEDLDRVVSGMPVLDAFANYMGADEIRLMGRKGFIKKLAPLGFEETCVVMSYKVARRH